MAFAFDRERIADDSIHFLTNLRCRPGAHPRLAGITAGRFEKVRRHLEVRNEDNPATVRRRQPRIVQQALRSLS